MSLHSLSASPPVYFKMSVKVLKSLADQQLYDSELQTERAIMLIALAGNTQSINQSVIIFNVA